MASESPSLSTPPQAKPEVTFETLGLRFLDKPSTITDYPGMEDSTSGVVPPVDDSTVPPKGTVEATPRLKSKGKPTTSFKEAVEKAPMSWADICELSDEDDKAFESIANLVDDKVAEEISSNTVLIPGGMSEFMPRWRNVIDIAARVCGLEVKESALKIEGVVATGLYSMDKDTYSTAKESTRANAKDVYMSWNTVNQIFSFFSKPIDVEKSDIGVGQGFVLDKMCIEWNKHALGEYFDEAKYKAGSRWHSLRPVLKKRIQTLLTKGEVKDVAELFVSALDFIVYKYIKRIYSSSRSSEYLAKVVKLCTSKSQQIVSSNLRRVKSKVSLEEGKGKLKKTVEKVKISLVKPWVRKSEAWTPKEQASVKVINDALTTDLEDVLKTMIIGGPVYTGAIGTKLMRKAWDLVDSFHEIEGLRRKHVRQTVISKRAEDKKKEKIKPEEWSLQMQLAITENSDGAKLKSYCDMHGFELEEGVITQTSIRNKLEKWLESAEEEFDDVCIDFDELEKVGSDPVAYHSELFKEVQEESK